MKTSTAIFLAALLGATTAAGQPATRSLKLWYDKPAANWNQALPIGNGRLAAMIFGGPATDRVQLNEETVWAGEPGNNVRNDLFPAIEKMRELVFAGKQKEAQEFGLTKIPRQAASDNNYGMQYQPVGDLLLRFGDQQSISGYRRDLDLSNALSTVTYRSNGVTYRREYFASLADGIILVRLSASKPGSLSFSARMTSPHKSAATAVAGHALSLSATTSSVDNKTGRVKFNALANIQAEGGSLAFQGDSVLVKQATSATIRISIGTNVKRYDDISGDPNARAMAALNTSKARTYTQLRDRHVQRYKTYFSRVDLQLRGEDHMTLPTDQRIREFSAGKDLGLVNLYFQFGRYLLISSSPPGSQPANLQGKWNDRMSPPWDSKYTININTEMNYWPAEVTGLTEMHQPLFAMINDLAVTGKESASKMYHARGWMAHHNTDLWRITGPVDGAFYGMWPMGGAWLSQHLWQHFLYSGDREFLAKEYAALKGAALFYVDALQKEPNHGWRVVVPSMSPENSPAGVGAGMAAGTTMDNQIVFDVFSNVIAAADLLKTDNAFADTLRQLRKELAPMQIGKHGQLQEWMDDLDRPTDQHRHISHLYGLFPSNQVSPFSHPELYSAARQSLVFRGDKSTGWSMGWKVNWWARLLDGNRAFKLITDQLSPAPDDNSGQNGGTYPNLFDAHPPFQIDGNFGCTSGIAEMLMQSHDGAVHILPALPDAWKSGSVSGLVSRGNFVIGMSWENGRLKTLSIRSRIGGVCRLRLPSKPLGATALALLKPASGKPSNPLLQSAEIAKPLQSAQATLNFSPPVDTTLLVDLRTVAGKTYTFSF